MTNKVMNKKHIYHFALQKFLLISIIIVLLYFLNFFIIFAIPILIVAYTKKENFDVDFWGYFWYGILFILIHLFLGFFSLERMYYARKDEKLGFFCMSATINGLSCSLFIQLVIQYINIFSIRFRSVHSNNVSLLWLKENFFAGAIRLLLCILCVCWTSLCFISALHNALNPESSYFVRKTERRIASIEKALRMYDVDYGRYPPHAPDLYSSKNLIIYLDGNPLNGGPKLIYCEFRPQELSQEKVLDDFGGEIYYRTPVNPDGSANPEIVNKKKFDLWSEGEITKAMGDTIGRDDIRNWEVPPPPSPIISYAFFCWILLVLSNITWFYLAQKIFHIPH